METGNTPGLAKWRLPRVNGLGSPFGMETRMPASVMAFQKAAKWPGKPVRDGTEILHFVKDDK